MTKYEHFKNSRWRTSAVLKVVFFGYNSAADCPISVKFCAGKQFSQNFGIGTNTGVPYNVLFVFLMKFGLRRAAYVYHDTSNDLLLSNSKSYGARFYKSIDRALRCVKNFLIGRTPPASGRRRDVTMNLCTTLRLLRVGTAGWTAPSRTGSKPSSTRRALGRR